MTVGIILAAGKGSRLKMKEKNKTSLKVSGKPLVLYGVELFEKTVDQTVVVVGAFAQSVKDVIGKRHVTYAHQTKRLGTGHALQVALKSIQAKKYKPSQIMLGYGDHMMSYTPEVISTMLQAHIQHHAAVTLISAVVDDPNSLAWGRIVRDENGSVTAIVEQKDATPGQREIKEVNAGFYCFDYEFVVKNIKKMHKSAVTGEYYITDLIEIARQDGQKIIAHTIPFAQVGMGVNTPEQLDSYQVEKKSLHWRKTVPVQL